ncbi:DUF4352 domain-containing protein [Streptomyces sp. NBC_00996]|uniref:DUF4352 domain-containing protein n=1 Tax=Streptomyces sp. NBC_00996 TaxID=2903710 RepID=UPI00386A8A36|nr:DUF4352 domain-containing protein [Streptomyces sp. NBC_00996]
MRIGTTTVTATLLLATACSSGGEPKTIHVTVTQTVTATPSAEAATDANAGVLKMGATKTIIDAETDVHATVQALSYQQPYKGPQPQPPEDFQGGDTWATADVKVCNIKGTEFTIDQFPWSLAYEDGTSTEVTGSSGGDMPKPEYPMDKTLTPGRCARGLVAFPVPSSKRPVRLVYQPGEGEPTEWAVPKA